MRICISKELNILNKYDWHDNYFENNINLTINKIKEIVRFQLIQRSINKLELRIVSDNRDEAFLIAKNKLNEFLRVKNIFDVEIYLSSELPKAHEISGKYNDTAVTMYYNGTTITFEHSGKEYSIVDTLGGSAPALILTETVNIGSAVSTETIIVRQDEFFGVWTQTVGSRTNTLTFDGCGDSYYVSNGKVADKKGYITYNRYYKVENGVVKIYDEGTNKLYATFVECEEGTDGAYVNGDKYYLLNLA